jgi:VanZ family protein
VPRALSLWLPVVLWAAVIFVFSAIPSLSTGLGTGDYVLRKCAHMTEYAILAALLARALRSEPRAFLLAVLYSASDEVHQTFVRGRQGNALDVVIDAAGAAIGLLIWRGRWR